MAGLLKLESVVFIGCLAADTLSAVQLLGQKRHNKTGKLEENNACRFLLSSKTSDTDVTRVSVNTGVLLGCQLKAS